jgi:hypothetical protein
MGSPRSGTTWLAKLLDTHPGVLYLHEPLTKLKLPALASLIERLLRTGSLEPEEADHLVGCLDRVHHECCRLPFFPKTFLRLSPWILTVAWAAAGLTHSSRSAFPRWVSPAPEADYDLLIKEVDWLSHAPNIVRGLKPDSLLFIVRHPCAVVNSRLNGLKMRVIFGHDRSQWLERSAARCEELGFSVNDVRRMPLWEFYALDWLLQNLSYRQIAQTRPRVMVVLYKDLCLDPTAVLTKVFSFLGWRINAQTQRFLQASTHSRLRRLMVRLWGGKRFYYDLYRDPAEPLCAWRHQLTPDQQDGIMRIARLFPDIAWWSEPQAHPEEGVVTVDGQLRVLRS